MCVHHRAWRSPPLGPVPSQSTDRPRPVSRATSPPPSPLNHAICPHAVAGANENVYERMNKTWNSLFLVAEALDTSSSVIEARVWSSSPFDWICCSLEIIRKQRWLVRWRPENLGRTEPQRNYFIYLLSVFGDPRCVYNFFLLNTYILHRR